MPLYTLNVSDTVSANDIITWDTMTSSWDTYTVTWDALNSIGAQRQTVKNPIETLVYSETKTGSFARSLQETLATTEAVSKSAARRVTDTLTGTDSLRRQAAKSATETTNLAETTARSIVLYRYETELTSENITEFLNGLELIWTKLASVSTDWTNVANSAAATYTNVGSVTTIWTPIEKTPVGYGTWDQMTITWDEAIKSWDYDGFDKTEKNTTTYADIPRAGTS